MQKKRIEFGSGHLSPAAPLVVSINVVYYIGYSTYLEAPGMFVKQEIMENAFLPRFQRVFIGALCYNSTQSSLSDLKYIAGNRTLCLHSEGG